MIIAYVTDYKTSEVTGRFSGWTSSRTRHVRRRMEERYGRAVSPLTSLLGTIIRCASRSSRLDDSRWPSRCPAWHRASYFTRTWADLVLYSDWSQMKIQRTLNVPLVTERNASCNLMWYCVYDMRVMFIYSYYYMSAFWYFFVCPLAAFAPWLHLCYMCLASHSHASS
jgi:hypothetical protein